MILKISSHICINVFNILLYVHSDMTPIKCYKQ